MSETPTGSEASASAAGGQDIVAELRDRESKNHCEVRTVTWGNDHRNVRTDDLYARAAAEIERLRAENERLEQQWRELDEVMRGGYDTPGAHHAP